ncbi:hypothetical protein HK404_03165 [Myxococcus xanthus]|nr:hypothetical protein [Myxococcus xanthus]QPM76600.1 hypothetical protein I5Q59_19695 [Myxococcus xanthus]QVW65664.1 hypothetical protein JTM82_25040 [Myxococcus xanthus DZ2]UEO08206.1 hypothetical protein K1515_17750 [Myxococcus xanthus DZ2]
MRGARSPPPSFALELFVKRLLSVLALPLLLLGTSAAAQTTPTLTFHGNWTIHQSEVLTEGGQVQVVYSTARLPQCRVNNPDGSPAWSITGHYRINGSAPASFDVAGAPVTGNGPTLDLQEQGLLELWFLVSSPGCEHYDSNYGGNFQFNVLEASATPMATLVFQQGWVEHVVGTPRQGQPFIVDYDIARLPECRLLYNGAPTWDVGVRWRFNNGVMGEKSVTTTSGYTRTGTPVTIIPPVGATSVQIWFENWDRGTCRRWDSDYGANYTFTLQP